MNFLTEIITFLLGENALADGWVGLGDIFSALYYKDTPAIMAILDPIYEGFWEFLIGLLNKFM
ncbi:MAG: hypothetical protein E7555_09665 [Ruminococcaceae bacterium]|nr:hypothetical protein [Oscillospiraceae bacterium]